MYWRTSGQKSLLQGYWHGPAQTIGRDDMGYWLFHHGIPIPASANLLRYSTLTERELMEKERQQRIAAGIPNETRGRIAGQRGFIDLANQASLFPDFPPAENNSETETQPNSSPDTTINHHMLSTVNDIQEEQLTPPEWEINSSNVPQNWIDIIGTASSDSRDRFVSYRTGPVNSFYFDASHGDPLHLQRRRIFRYENQELMEDLTLENGLLENFDVNNENDTQLGVVIEYTFRNPKRQLDDKSREQARADGSEAAAKRLDGHPSIQPTVDPTVPNNVVPTQETSIQDNVNTQEDETMQENNVETQPGIQPNDAVPTTDVNGEQVQAENIPVSDRQNEHIDMPVDNGMDDELVAPSPVANQPEQSTSCRRHTRRKPDPRRLSESSPPETKKSRLNENDYWVDTFLAERTESYVQKQKKLGRN